jgi:hypothetical protein
MAGPSNAGLTHPAHSSAISLGQLTTTVLAYEMTELADASEVDLIGQIGLGLGMQIVMELVDRVGDSFLEVHTEQTAQEDEKERLIRHVVELAAAHGTVDPEAVARDREVTPDEVQDCIDEAIAEGLIARTGRLDATDAGQRLIAGSAD